jgi:2-methylcitrate dehydratase PrpD
VDRPTSASHDERTLLEWLASYSHSVDMNAVPEEVARQSALCLLDTVGCIVAGAQTPEARAFYQAEKSQHGELGEWPQEVTARVFGFLGDILELNDLIGGHSSIGVVTAVLSNTYYQDISGSELLRAVVAGTEVTARLYESSIGNFKPYSDGGTVVVSYFNAIGAAAALSLIQSFDENRTAHAMAISSTISTWCPAEVIFGQGGTIKPILFGANPASSAVQAVNYARHGLTGPLRLLESPIGLMRSLATDFDPGKLQDTERWFITTPQRKLHASCGYTHASIDAVSSMEFSDELLGNIASIDVAVPAFFREAVGKVGAPKSSNDARFHLGYVVALAIQGNYPILPEHTLDFEHHLAQGRTLELSEKVRIVPDDSVAAGTSKPYNVSKVTVRFRDGAEKSSTCLSPKGSADDPMSDGDVVRKFVQLVSPSAGEADAKELAESILGIGQSNDISSIANAVRGIIVKELQKN